jgi:hypothetical protein
VDNKRIIGLLCVWCAEDWVIPALRQASEYCDEVFINVSAYSDELLKYEDGTLDNTKEFIDNCKKGNVKLVEYKKEANTHFEIKHEVLNTMLLNSSCYNTGNWVWVLDVDEFYPIVSYDYIREFIRSKDSEETDCLLVEELFFYINFRHYLTGSHFRLFQIREYNTDEYSMFTSVNNWFGCKKTTIVPIDYGMFHYSMLLDPWVKKVFWDTHYKDKSLRNNVINKHMRWLENIYRNYDLNNQDYWVDKNEELFGIRSPWFSPSFRPDESGRLFNFDGEHPWALWKTDLLSIEDFRVKYNFLPYNKIRSQR